MATLEHRISPARRFFSLLKVEKEDILNIYLYSIIFGLINFTLPLGIQSIINLITSGQITTSWIVLMGLVLGGIVVGGYFQIKQLSVSESLQQKIFARAAFEFAYRLPMITQETMDKHHNPELVNRFFDSITIQKGLTKILMDFSGAILMVLLGLIILCLYHPFFIFFSLFVLGYISIIFFLTTKRGVTTSLRESKYKYEVAYWLEEIARGLDIFRYTSRTEMHLQKTDDLVNHYIGARKSHFDVLKGKYRHMIVFKALVAAGLLGIGGWLVLEQKMNIGQFVASEIIIILLLNSVEKVILNMETIYDVLTSLDKLGQVTDMPLEEPKGLVLNYSSMSEGLQISLRDAGYNYPNNSRSIVSSISLDIYAGERIAILGTPGSGKTTMMGIASAALPPKSGTLLFNEIPVSNLNIPALRKYISVIRNTEQIFKGSIMENLTMGEKNPDIETISRICDTLGLSDFIFNSANGFDTQLLPAGKGIPYAVAYKILVARTLLTEPKLVLISEGIERLSESDRKVVAAALCDRMNQFTLMAFTNDEIIASFCNSLTLLRGRGVTEKFTFDEAKEKQLFSKLR